MRNLSNDELLNVTGGAAAPDKTYQSTVDFIANHKFFHEGVMNLPIGGGKHFRNVPFVGPGEILAGAYTGTPSLIAKGAQVTRGTWDAK